MHWLSINISMLVYLIVLLECCTVLLECLTVVLKSIALFDAIDIIIEEILGPPLFFQDWGALKPLAPLSLQAMYII